MSAIPFQIPSVEELSGLLPAYDFDSLIAHGGTGAVYRARQKSLDRDVAVKILPRELVGDSLFRESFAAEAKATARLAHTNLIKVYDHGDADGMLYVVMEYVHGSSLSKAASGKKIDAAQAVEIILKACRGLAHAHGQGMIHRDIKPGNILLTQECEPKICDFGMVRPDGIVIGTHGYAAPEVIGRPGEIDHRSDIFAIGVILKEMLTGVSADSDDFPRVSCDDPRLAAICDKASAVDPQLRYSDIGELCGALENWQRQRRPGRLHIPANRPSVPRPKPSVSGRRSSPPQVHVGRGNWRLCRDLAIIAVLLVALRHTWNIYKDKQAFIAKQQRSVLENAAKPPAAPKAVATMDAFASARNDY